MGGWQGLKLYLCVYVCVRGSGGAFQCESCNCTHVYACVRQERDGLCPPSEDLSIKPLTIWLSINRRQLWPQLIISQSNSSPITPLLKSYSVYIFLSSPILTVITIWHTFTKRPTFVWSFCSVQLSWSYSIKTTSVSNICWIIWTLSEVLWKWMMLFDPLKFLLSSVFLWKNTFCSDWAM